MLEKFVMKSKLIYVLKLSFKKLEPQIPPFLFVFVLILNTCY
jgi:hypothetical protein